MMPGYGWRRNSRPRLSLRNALAPLLSKRTAELFLQHCFKEEQGASRIANACLADLNKASMQRVTEQLNGLKWMPAGTEGYRTAEVTLGGVDTDELSSQTMEAKQVPGLYMIGEVVDVTGQLGGYNFQWAWASGWVAGQAL